MREWIPHNKWVNRPEYEAAVARAMRRGYVGQGPEVYLLEEELAERFRPGGKAICVSSGSAAIALAARALSCLWQYWYVPAYACPDIWRSLTFGLHEVWVKPLDSNPDGSVPNTSIHVHLFGKATPVPPSARIEDFTHSPGICPPGFPVCGSNSTLSVISFGATKPLGAGGGGAILGDPDVIDEIRNERGQGQYHRSFNWDMSDLHAAIVRERLKLLSMENEWREDTAERYDQALGIIPEIPFPGLYNTFYRYTIKPDTKEQAAKAHRILKDACIDTIHPIEPSEIIGHQELYPNAWDLACRTISIPIWPGMEEEHVSRVCETLEKVREVIQ